MENRGMESSNHLNEGKKDEINKDPRSRKEQRWREQKKSKENQEKTEPTDEETSTKASSMLLQAMSRMKYSRQNKQGKAKDNGTCEATLTIPASSKGGKIASDQLRNAVARGDQQI
jgi:hypothetical protein